MCNPRRINVSVTREIEQAWQWEISRSVELDADIQAEARISQPLSSTLGEPVLRALESLLDSGDSGWQEVPNGYRYEVEGGYVIYDFDAQSLEIIAVQQGHIQTSATVNDTLVGTLSEQLEHTEAGNYYDDGWGGRTEERAKQEAEDKAGEILDKLTRERLQQAQQNAEQEHQDSIQSRARDVAQAQLEQLRLEQDAQLASQARTHLETVGVRCRQAFNTLLGQAYRNAILSYARNHGAENIQCQEEGDTVEIEFFMDS